MTEVIVAIIALTGTVVNGALTWSALKRKATHREVTELTDKLEKATERITYLEAELERHKKINQELQDKNISLMKRFLKELDKNDAGSH